MTTRPSPSAGNASAVTLVQPTFPERVWAWMACFRSIQLAIVLLSLLALATLAGVLLPQEGLVETVEIKRSVGIAYRTMKAMGLFHVYSSYWFIALEVLFFINLLCGSFQWLRPAFLAATRKTFCGLEHMRASSQALGYDSPQPMGVVTQQVSQWLRNNRYGVYAGPSAAAGSPASEDSSPVMVKLYATKGNFSRFGPVVAHLGILMMLVASVYGAFFGFKAQKLAVPGETFALQDSQMFKTNVDPSVWLGSVPTWKVKVNDFKMEYYPEGQIPSGAPQMTTVKQYYADLSVINAQGHEIKREVISVNHPLTVDDTVLYQASFNPTGKLFMNVDGQPMKLSTNTEFMNRPVSLTELKNGQALMVFPFFVQQDPQVTRNYVVVFLRDAKGFVGARPGQMPPNLRLLEGQSGELAGIRFQYIKPEFSTGLQIKKGPEVPWMYLSYVIIMVGTIMCIFSQRQVWVAVAGHSDGVGCQVWLMYKTNKARLSFMKELQRFQQAMVQSVGLKPIDSAEAMPNEVLAPSSSASHLSSESATPASPNAMPV